MADDFDSFDLDDPKLPGWVADQALTSGEYPYDKRLKKKTYEKTLRALQIELVKLQAHLGRSGERVLILFEGRDAAGKGGTIQRYLQNLNARTNRTVALSKPTEAERGQWYFQRHIAHLPGAGEQVLFDRSWYNRAVVEPVMGFCTPAETELFFREVPRLEEMLVADGIHLFKFWLNIGRHTQVLRFHERRHDPVKVWKLSPVDLEALGKWDDYTAARDRMLRETGTAAAPWTVIRANDKRRARLEAIRTVLDALDYEGQDEALVSDVDRRIVRPAAAFLGECCGEE